MSRETTELTLFHKGETEMALLLSDDGDRWVWVAKSLCASIGTLELIGEMPEIEIEIPEWLAEQEEWI